MITLRTICSKGDANIGEYLIVWDAGKAKVYLDALPEDRRPDGLPADQESLVEFGHEESLAAQTHGDASREAYALFVARRGGPMDDYLSLGTIVEL